MSTDNDNILFGNGDELPSNRSGNTHIQDVINLGRRQVLAGGASLGALAFLGRHFRAQSRPPANRQSGSRIFR